MAKPKEKTAQLSAAFLEKCGKEKDRLRKKLAKQLRMDMERMLQEDIHTDLEFILKGGKSVGHRLILKSRARGLWDRLCQASSSDSVSFPLQCLDKSVFDSYLFQVYGSDQADVASEELMVAMEDRGDSHFPPCLDTSHASDELFCSGGADATTARLLRKDRISVDSLETDPGTTSAVSLISLSASGGDNSVLPTEQINGEPSHVREVPREAFELFQGAYSLDMIPSAHFAAGHDILAADPSSLFVLPNGQEINNNDANNNGLDANQLVGNQNLPPFQPPRVVNLQPQVVDLVSHAVPVRPPAPSSLLPDIQSQDTACAHGASAHAALPDLITTSCCTALPHQTCSRLGEDLLRAYLQEIDCDCTISVDSQDFKSHRCILAARSCYFTAMLGGAWMESEADKIHLEGVSPGAVEQALLYIYGGVVELTDLCNIAELILLSDMYGLEGLRDIISLNLRMTKCHFFHKVRVLETLSIAESFRFEELEDRCVKWINKNLSKVWPTKGFALLPEALLHKCCQAAVQDLSFDGPIPRTSELSYQSRFSDIIGYIYTLLQRYAVMIEPWKQGDSPLSVFLHTKKSRPLIAASRHSIGKNPENVLDVIMECDKLSTSLPRLKWTEPVLALITRLMDSAMEFTSQHFTGVIGSERFIDLGKSMAWSMTLLDTIFSSVIKSLPVDHICKTYLCIFTLTERTKSPDCSWTEDFQSFILSLLEKCEGYIKLYTHQVVHTPDWDLLSKDCQHSLLEAASYVCIDTNRGRAPPKLSSMNKRPRQPPIPKTPPKTSTGARPKTAAASVTKLEKSRNNASLQRQFQKRLASERAHKVEKTGSCGSSGPGQASKPRPKSGVTGTKVKSPDKIGTASESGVNVQEPRKVQEDSRPRSSSLVTHGDLVATGGFENGPDPPGTTADKQSDQGRVSPKSDSSVPVRRRRRGSTGDIPAVLSGVSRSRSEELHLANRGDNSIMQLVPIFETKFTLPNQTLPAYSEDF